MIGFATEIRIALNKLRWFLLLFAKSIAWKKLNIAMYGGNGTNHTLYEFHNCRF